MHVFHCGVPDNILRQERDQALLFASQGLKFSPTKYSMFSERYF